MADYDVIVIGCGPAGMMACGELAKRGIKVLGIDKKPLLGLTSEQLQDTVFWTRNLTRNILK